MVNIQQRMANPIIAARRQLRNCFSLLTFAPENLVLRDGFGQPVPRHSTHSQAESGTLLARGLLSCLTSAFLDGIVHLYHQSPQVQFRIYQVTPLRTDGVHRRASTGSTVCEDNNNNNNNCETVGQDRTGPDQHLYSS